jgi:hypothetical protein
MTPSDKTITNPNLTAVALDLFKGRSTQSGLNTHQMAITCFRDAKIFLAAAEQVHAGKLDIEEDESNALDIAFAPNLKRTHPINLMSRAWGDLQAVQKVLAYLDANPKADFYEPHSWGKPEVNQARALFPAVVDRARQFVAAK